MALRFRSFVTGGITPPPDTSGEVNINTGSTYLSHIGRTAAISGTPATPTVVTNYATAAMLAGFAATAPTTEAASINVTGPYGVTIPVTPVTLSGTAVWGNSVGGAVATFANSTAIRASVWIMNTTSTFAALNITAATATPTATASNSTTAGTNIWQRVSVDVTGTFTASTTIEFRMARTTASGTNVIYVWEDSLMFEDYSTPWDGLHELHGVAAQLASGPLNSYVNEIVPILWCGDSISYGCCATDIPAGKYPLARTLMQKIEGTWDVEGQCAGNGWKSGGIKSELISAVNDTHATLTPESLDRPMYIWIGTNDFNSSVPAVTTLANVKSCIALATARGNYKYRVITPMFRADDLYANGAFPPSGAVYLKCVEFCNLARSDSVTRDNLIDVNLALGYNFTEITPTDWDDTNGNFSDDLHLTTKGYCEMVYPIILADMQASGWFAR